MEKENINYIGLVIFFAGLIMLIFVFITAYKISQNPEILKIGFPEGIEEENAFSALFENIIKSIIYIGSLWIMGSISSRICSEGIKLYKEKK
ncbi:MAG: hypothetical protein KAX04_00545 [Methanomicrobia archaeon]|nr:hypothetical protein [Methanomicrobia archaeon]